MEIRCSGLARPMVCAGYLSFTGFPEDESSPAAREGTAAGELLERMVRGRQIGQQAENGVYFDQDMYFYLTPICEEIKQLAQSEVLCEQRIDWTTRSGITIRGQYDFSFVSNGALYIDDLKYGWGIVDVKENWQLLGYAIGEVIRRGIAFERIVLRIHQPRPHHEDGTTREWVLTYAELLEYKERIEKRMEMIAAGDKTLQTGKSCKYCPAAAEMCPAFNRLFYRGLEVSTEFVQDELDETGLARQLDQAHRALEAIKIKMDSLNELAISRVRAGKVIPGYVQETTWGHRKWVDGVDPKAIELLTGKKIMREEMISPTQFEKLKIPKQFVDQFTRRPMTGQKMVRKDGSTVGNKIFGNNAPTMAGG